jgi:hypothetical protein
MLTVQFVPYSAIENKDSDARIDYLLEIVKEGNIVFLQGKLKPKEETLLIQRTMEIVDKSFNGIEISAVEPQNKNKAFFDSIKRFFIKTLMGDSVGVTIIGPANIIQEIKRDPEKMQLLIDNNTETKKDEKKKGK